MDTTFHYRSRRLFARRQWNIPTGRGTATFPRCQVCRYGIECEYKIRMACRVHFISSNHRNKKRLAARITSSLYINMYLSILLSALFAAPIFVSAVPVPRPSTTPTRLRLGGPPECWDEADATGYDRDTSEGSIALTLITELMYSLAEWMDANLECLKDVMARFPEGRTGLCGHSQGRKTLRLGVFHGSGSRQITKLGPKHQKAAVRHLHWCCRHNEANKHCQSNVWMRMALVSSKFWNREAIIDLDTRLERCTSAVSRRKWCSQSQLDALIYPGT